MRVRPNEGLALVRAGLLFFVLPSPSFADPIQLDFAANSPTPSPASISYAGGAAPLVGSSIQIDTLLGIATPANPAVTVTCVSCLLNFTTGLLTGTSSSPSAWLFGGGAGSSITITGGLDFDGGGIGVGDIPVGTTLLTGTFGNAQVVAFSPSTFKIAGGSFFDVKDPGLLAFYGISPDSPLEGSLNISFNGSGTPPDGFSSDSVVGGHVVNTVLPEPTSVWLLGVGLFGMAAATRGRRGDT